MVLAGDHVQILVDGYELTGDHNKVVINDARKLLAASAFGEAVEKYLPGQRQAKLEHNGYFNPETGRSHPVLNGVLVDGVVSIVIGQNAEPVIGDPMYNLLSQQEQYISNAEVGNIVPFSANFTTRTGQRAGWGLALAVPVSMTNTSNGSSLDNGNATNNGGMAFLHILKRTASDLYDIEVEGSSDNSAWSSLGSFTLDGSALGSESLALSGTVPRYLRYSATRSGSAGDSLKLAISVVRF